MSWDTNDLQRHEGLSGEGEGAELLAKELARSDHGVRLVKNVEELQTELGSGAYDVVIAAYADRSSVEPSGRASLPMTVGRRSMRHRSLQQRIELIY